MKMPNKTPQEVLEHNTAYYEGLSAGMKGETTSNSFYELGSPNQIRWVQGWEEGDLIYRTVDLQKAYGYYEPETEEDMIPMAHSKILSEFYLLVGQDAAGQYFYWHWSLGANYEQGWYPQSYGANHFANPDFSMTIVQPAFDGSHFTCEDHRIIQNTVRFVKCHLSMAIDVEDQTQ